MSDDGFGISWKNRNLSTQNVAIGRILYRVGGFCGPRIQQDYQLISIHAGDSAVKVNDTDLILKTGHTYFFKPRDHLFFTFSKVVGTFHSWCTIIPSKMPDDLIPKLLQSSGDILTSDAINRLLSIAFDISPTESCHSGELIESLGLTLFCEYLYQSGLGHNGRHCDPILNLARQYMELHFADETCLHDTSSYVRVSPGALNRHFKEELHTTVDRYLWKLRAEKGVVLLTDTIFTISEVAYLSGFKNVCHFSRKVKAVSGFSPREIRQGALRRRRMEGDGKSVVTSPFDNP